MATQNIDNLGSLVTAIETLQRDSGGASVGLLLGDLDGLQRINSRFGYAAGDKAIEVFHQKLQAIAREGDLAIRINGTLFALLIKDPLHEGHALLAAEKVSQLAEDWIVITDVRLRLGVHIGVSLLPSSADTAQKLLAQAESARRFCKSIGERFALWRKDIDVQHGTLTHALFDAKSAIENGEFRVHFQPKIELATGQPVGAEALVRWQSPDGLISPQNFLSEIERARAMAPLLQFMVNSSARQVARWARYSPEFTVAINATTTDIEDADLVEILNEVLGMWSIDPHHLMLEVTEGMLMKDLDRSIDTLNQLRAIGIKTSIDDFGTGYSSLAYLRDLPVDELKIDRRFIRSVAEDKVDRDIVASLISLAHAMELRVVAEGIESQLVADTLRALNCDTGQGFYYGEPVTAQEFESRWMLTQKDHCETEA